MSVFVSVFRKTAQSLVGKSGSCHRGTGQQTGCSVFMSVCRVLAGKCGHSTGVLIVRAATPYPRALRREMAFSRKQRPRHRDTAHQTGCSVSISLSLETAQPLVRENRSSTGAVLVRQGPLYPSCQHPPSITMRA